MNNLLITFLSLSISGTLLILVLLLFKHLYKNKLSKKWQYYIWIIVIARLILPFAPQTSLVGNFFADIAPHIAELVEDVAMGNENNDYSQTNAGNKPLISDEAQPMKPTFSIIPNIPMLSNVWIFWLVAALILFIRKITIYQSFVKYVRAGCEEVTDIERLEQFGEIVDTQKVKAGIEIYTNNLISSPLLIGFWKPCIILPTANIPTPDFKFTILHEITHYKRKDIFYKWLTQIVICLHWFNPFVYLISGEINQACELSCDEAVISKLDLKEKRAYGDTLLNAIKAGGNYKNSIASVTLYESKKLLSERLGAIMSYKKQTGIITCFSIILACLFLCGAAYAGAYPIQKEPSNPQALDNIRINTTKEDTVSQNLDDNTKSEPLNKSNTTDIPIYTSNSFGITEISVSVESLNSGAEVCIGEISDIRNANKIQYNIQSKSGGSLYIGIRSAIETDVSTRWFHYIGSGSGNVVWESNGTVSYDTEYTGNYYVFVQSKYGNCTDINGSIEIEYNK